MTTAFRSSLPFRAHALAALAALVALSFAGCADDGFGELAVVDPGAEDPAAYGSNEEEDLGIDVSAIAMLQKTPIKNVATGKCIDEPAVPTGLVLPVNQSTCNGAASQILMLHALGTSGFGIRNVATGKCIELEGTAATGYKLRQATCNLGSSTTNTQRFFWGAAGPTPAAGRALVSGFDTSLCIDVPGALPANGLRLRLFACSGGANQKWLTL